MAKKNPPKAFPTFPEPGCYTSHGMTLRDYFAAKAINKVSSHMPENVATDAYRIADAMLKERDK